MIIKATRLQAWTLAGRGGGKSRPSPPPLEKKEILLAILGAFLLPFLYMGAFLLRFSHFWGPFHHVGAFLLRFTSWWGTFFVLPPPHPMKNFAGAHDCKEGSRACSPGNFFVWPQFSEFWTCFVTILP